jgi:hypothetical protein
VGMSILPPNPIRWQHPHSRVLRLICQKRSLLAVNHRSAGTGRAVMLAL